MSRRAPACTSIRRGNGSSATTASRPSQGSTSARLSASESAATDTTPGVSRSSLDRGPHLGFRRRRALRQHLHRQPPGQSRLPGLRGALGDQHAAERQRREERHDRDHEIERDRALLARQDAPGCARRRCCPLSAHRSPRISITLPSTRRSSRARVLSIKRPVVGGDHHRGAEAIELDEQPDQALADVGIDIARRLVGEKDVGLGDDRARDRHALLLAARKRRRLVVQPLAQSDPGQQLLHVLAVVADAPAGQPQGQRDIVERGQMIEQAEFLEHDADAAAQRRQLGALRACARSLPNSEITPREGCSASSTSFRSVVLPAPDGPVRKVNEPGSSAKLTSRRTSRPAPYRMPTFSKRTMPRSTLPD